MTELVNDFATNFKLLFGNEANCYFPAAYAIAFVTASTTALVPTKPAKYFQDFLLNAPDWAQKLIGFLSMYLIVWQGGGAQCAIVSLGITFVYHALTYLLDFIYDRSG